MALGKKGLWPAYWKQQRDTVVPQPKQNMVVAAMMLWSIPAPEESEAREMYWNLCNLVEKATV
jgi:hypothetical protein